MKSAIPCLCFRTEIYDKIAKLSKDKSQYSFFCYDSKKGFESIVDNFIKNKSYEIKEITERYKSLE